MLKVKDIKEGIKKDLNLKENKDIHESVYMKIPKKFDLITDLVSSAALKQHYELYTQYTKRLNKANIELNSMLKNKNEDIQKWRAVKKEEQYCNNASYLHELFFEELGSSANSEVYMDSLSFMELQSQWGEFNFWQKDFINTAMASNQGWCITGHCLYTGKLMNICLDGHDLHMVPCVPLIVLDVFEHSYYRDYDIEKKSYVINFMKSIKWDVVEERFEALAGFRQTFKK